MTPAVDSTHDARLRSWVESANHPVADFPVQNLPLGVFRRGGEERPRIGCAIGASVLDLAACARHELLAGLPEDLSSACGAKDLNPLMALLPERRTRLRQRLSRLLQSEEGTETARPRAAEVLVPQSECEMLLPAAIGDYTDFYASCWHATNVGRMLRPDNPLLPNYKWVPIGYHGRASSIVVSGTPVIRPQGQTAAAAGTPAPGFGPSRSLDYELEVGAFLGPGNALGRSIPCEEAASHIFGLVLVNDWSARDLQKWEYQPLGPFLAKSFGTSISPWVVTSQALAPFRVPAFARPPGDPSPLPYLDSEEDRLHGGVDLHLEVLLSTPLMREGGRPPERVGCSNLRELYWTLAQLVTHHASNGCNLRPGDLIASGTVSGEPKESRGCLLERTWGGSEPLRLASGEERRFLEDGDEVILRGHCEREGFARIGLGECRGVVAPALGPRGTFAKQADGRR